MSEKSKLSDFVERLTSWKTTILGLVSGLVIILVATGVIGKEESGQISPVIDSIWGSVIMILGGINSLVLLFSKDGEAA